MVQTSILSPKFWFNEVDSDSVRLNKIRGLVWHIQRDMKLESGNPGDIGHSSYMNLVDVFITADVRFSKALTELKSLMSLPANVLLLNRNDDLMGQMKEAFQ